MKKNQIKAAIKYCNTTATEIATEFGTTKQNFASKLSRETFTDDELKRMAEIMGCKYVCHFEFPDGTKI